MAIKGVLKDMQEVLGERPAVMCRELSKLHEEFVRSTLSTLTDHIEKHPPKGEITLVIGK